MDIKIAIAYHKQSIILTNDIYIPIQVGKSLQPEINLGIQGDNQGVNISKENIYYCELTATYWLWKNVNADVKGLFHYRRILDSRKPIKLYLKKIRSLITNMSFKPQNHYSEKEFLEASERMAYELPNLLSKYEILCSAPSKLPQNVSKFFSIIGHEYICILEKAIQNLYPEYTSTLKLVLANKSIYFGNLTVMKSNIFDSYCQFLFDVLEEVKNILIEEKYLIDLQNEKMFNRKLGYLGEILTYTYIVHNKNFKTKCLSVGSF